MCWSTAPELGIPRAHNFIRPQNYGIKTSNLTGYLHNQKIQQALEPQGSTMRKTMLDPAKELLSSNLERLLSQERKESSLSQALFKTPAPCHFKSTYATCWPKQSLAEGIV